MGVSYTDSLVSNMSKAMGENKGNVVLLVDRRKKLVINIVKSGSAKIVYGFIRRMGGLKANKG